MKHRAFNGSAIVATLLVTSLAWAQAPAPTQSGERGGGRGRGQAQPAVVSPEVSSDRRITFRIFAPQAQAVRLNASDIPNMGQSATLTKGENNVWSTTVGPVDSGAYRYTFNVDGVATLDPRSPTRASCSPWIWAPRVARLPWCPWTARCAPGHFARSSFTSRARWQNSARGTGGPLFSPAPAKSSRETQGCASASSRCAVPPRPKGRSASTPAANRSGTP